MPELAETLHSGHIGHSFLNRASRTCNADKGNKCPMCPEPQKPAIFQERDTAMQIPKITAYQTDKINLMVVCPYCGGWHVHGSGEWGVGRGHVVNDCDSGTGGYFIADIVRAEQPLRSMPTIMVWNWLQHAEGGHPDTAAASICPLAEDRCRSGLTRSGRMSTNPPMVKLGRVFAKVSAAGNDYFVGRLGAARLLMFRDRETPDCWNLFVQTVEDSQPPPRQTPERGPDARTLTTAAAKRAAKSSGSAKPPLADDPLDDLWQPP